jgi:hypothetical protein
MLVFTPDNLRAAYNYLSETEPFVNWNLPDADDVTFFVDTKSVRHSGRCYPLQEDGHYRIEISSKFHHHTLSLMETMAHEMVHVHEFHNGIPVKRHHGKTFKLLAAEVCAIHGFDPGKF